MLGLRYHKANPTDYVMEYVNGRLRGEGAGLAFYYLGSISTIVSVPQASTNVPFVFTEPTADFQNLTVQGQMTYRIAEPKKAAAMLDFTLDGKGRYASDQYQKLPERLVYSLQTLLRTEIQKHPLRAALLMGDALVGSVLDRWKASSEVVQHGIEILNLAVLALKPTPEMAKALEAEAREALNRKADEAVYMRRNAAIEQERQIKENDLKTEFLLQEKKRELRELDLAAEITFEQQRAALTEQKAENERKEADSRAYALQAMIAPVKELDWRLVMMLHPNGGDAGNTIAMAFQELAGNAQKIGELNISPDLLNTLLRNRAA